MGKNFFFFTFFVFAISSSFGQSKSYKNTPKNDVMAPNKDLVLGDSSKIVIRDSSESSSYFQADIGAGNEIYSNKNKLLNSKQNKPIFSLIPSLEYYNKSGFSLSTKIFFISTKTSIQPFQYSLTPGYEYMSKSKLNFSVSYSHIMEKDKYSIYASPIQNDYYGSVIYMKKWLNPGIEFGYSTGNSFENYHIDTTINNKIFHVYDSSRTNLKATVAVFSLQHTFKYKSVFAKSDHLEFAPKFIVNVGAEKSIVSNNSNFFEVLRRKRKMGKLKSSQSSFQPESIQLALDASYEIGSFNIEPEIYFDHDLLSTWAGNITHIFQINIGYTF